MDDTPPGNLRSSSGGAVLETDVGGIIGTAGCRRSQQPTPRYHLRLGWPERRGFEIIDGRILKLRDGVDLLRRGRLTREVVVIVSDGSNEAAHLIAFAGGECDG